MKKNIAAFLIPCLLLQLFGCYSFNVIPLKEMKNENELIITKKDSSIYHLKKKLNEYEMLTETDVYFSNEWRIIPEIGMIALKTQKAFKENNSGLSDYEDYGNWGVDRGCILKKDTTSINFNEITNVSAERVNLISTGLVVILGLSFVIGTIIGIGISSAFKE
jgi:hypothetical protein